MQLRSGMCIMCFCVAVHFLCQVASQRRTWRLFLSGASGRLPCAVPHGAVQFRGGRDWHGFRCNGPVLTAPLPAGASTRTPAEVRQRLIDARPLGKGRRHCSDIGRSLIIYMYFPKHLIPQAAVAAGKRILYAFTSMATPPWPKALKVHPLEVRGLWLPSCSPPRAPLKARGRTFW